MNIELATGEQALVRLRRIERPTSNVEWEKQKKQKSEVRCQRSEKQPILK